MRRFREERVKMTETSLIKSTNVIDQNRKKWLKIEENCPFLEIEDIKLKKLIILN